MTEHPFSFEVAATITESDYLGQSMVARPRSARGRIILITASILGGAALFSLKTAPLGGIILAITAFAWTAPRWSRWSAKRSYRETKYLHGLLTFGVSDQKLWFRSGTLSSESTWDGLAVWHETNGKLRLSASGMPELNFNVDDLKAAGVYDVIRERLGRYGVEFDSPEANRRLAAT